MKITEFYEKVEFCELTQNKFNDFLNSFDINQMANELWRKFKVIISPYNKSNDQNRHYYSNDKLFEYDELFQWNYSLFDAKVSWKC